MGIHSWGFMYTFSLLIVMVGILSFLFGFIVRDYQYSMKNKKPNDVQQPMPEISGVPKEGEYHPIFIKIDKNELGGYTSIVYNRYGTHLTKENRQHFVNILHHMIVKENELRSHKLKLLTFKKDN